MAAFTFAGVLVVVGLPQLEVQLLVLDLRHHLEQLPPDRYEGVLHRASRLGARLEPSDLLVLQKVALAVLQVLPCRVAFVAHRIDLDIVPAVGSHLVEPDILDLVKRLGIGGVEDEDDSICIVVVGFSDAFESLLPGSVPDLHFYVEVVNGNGPT